jgi:glucuronate isomerase
MAESTPFRPSLNSRLQETMPITHAMPDPIAREIFAEIARWPIYDPHTHINPHRPAARHFDEILGYHYYTELAHSTGMPVEMVAPELEPEARVANVIKYLERIDSTVQYSWLLEIAKTFHKFPHDRITPANCRDLLDRADQGLDGAAWDREVWQTSHLEAVFLTNDFDDSLEGWDTRAYVPCLRTDDLVLKLHTRETIARLRSATGIHVEDYASLRAAIGRLFDRFVSRGARACAISLPPDFVPRRAVPPQVLTPIRKAIHGLELRPDEHHEIRSAVFWMLAEFCADYRLPFDLMIGPVRNVYPAGVTGGRDLFDRRVSLYDYRDLFNHFTTVIFPVSTLAPDASAELVAYAWIFPNVLPMGHWWYANVPAYITGDVRARLQALPKVKLLGYYSDAYKLEFIAPKFNMYRRILAEVLGEDAVRGHGWSIDDALQLAKLVLIDNPKRIFGGSGETSTRPI